MTLSQARVVLAPFGLTIRKSGDEYRVAWRYASKYAAQTPEDSAYYTPDLNDAVATGLAMGVGV